MGLLALGLLLFLGAHSVRIFADGWRTRQIERFGKQAWRGLYSLVSICGLVLIVAGFSKAGVQETWWVPLGIMPYITRFLVLFAFLLVAAAYVPGNRLKAAIGHPMLMGVMAWAFAHLLSNGQPKHILLFGSFLVWATVDFAHSRRRDRAAGVIYPAGGLKGDVIAMLAGIAGWLAFAYYLHKSLIGVTPPG